MTEARYRTELQLLCVFGTIVAFLRSQSIWGAERADGPFALSKEKYMHLTRFSSYWHPPHAPPDAVASGHDPIVCTCLVVAAQSARRELLCRAARATGWTVTPFADASDAVAHCQRLIVELAIIDTDGLAVSALQPFDELLDRIGGPNSPNTFLLVVCAHDENCEVEIWAHQHREWMYLSGAIDELKLPDFLSEAREIVLKKRRKPQPY
jgi:hypothetical protein